MNRLKSDGTGYCAKKVRKCPQSQHCITCLGILRANVCGIYSCSSLTTPATRPIPKFLYDSLGIIYWLNAPHHGILLRLPRYNLLAQRTPFRNFLDSSLINYSIYTLYILYIILYSTLKWRKKGHGNFERGQKSDLKNHDEKSTKKNAKNESKKARRNPALFYVFGFSVFRPKSAFRKSLSSFAGL